MIVTSAVPPIVAYNPVLKEIGSGNLYTPDPEGKVNVLVITVVAALVLSHNFSVPEVCELTTKPATLPKPVLTNTLAVVFL
jgi:hypothetical protein